MKTETILLLAGAGVVAFMLYTSSKPKSSGSKGTTKAPTNFWDTLSALGVAGIGKLGGSSSSANSSPSSVHSTNVQSWASSDEMIDPSVGDFQGFD